MLSLTIIMHSSHFHQPDCKIFDDKDNLISSYIFLNAHCIAGIQKALIVYDYGILSVSRGI